MTGIFGAAIAALVLSAIATVILFLESLVFMLKFKGNQFTINWMKVPLYWFGLWILFIIVWFFVENGGSIVAGAI